MPSSYCPITSIALDITTERCACLDALARDQIVVLPRRRAAGAVINLKANEKRTKQRQRRHANMRSEIKVMEWDIECGSASRKAGYAIRLLNPPYQDRVARWPQGGVSQSYLSLMS